MKSTKRHHILDVSIRTLKNFILDKHVSSEDALILHPDNMDKIVLEFRKTYKESLIFPFYITGVLIEEDLTHVIGINQVGIIKNYQPDKNIRK